MVTSLLMARWYCPGEETMLYMESQRGGVVDTLRLCRASVGCVPA